MKMLLVFAACLSAQLFLTEGTILPDYFPQPCSKNVANYNECFSNFIQKLGPHLVKGVKELNFPKLNPLEIPTFVVNRTINDFISIAATLKNIKIWGFETTNLKKFRFDPEAQAGELHLNIKNLQYRIEYESNGYILTTDLSSRGVFSGNASDIDLSFKFALKTIEKLGVKYYALDHFRARSTIGSSRVVGKSDNPEIQNIIDLAVNFVNENPRRALDIVQPIYEEAVQVFYQELAEQILSKIPANELIPQ